MLNSDSRQLQWNLLKMFLTPLVKDPGVIRFQPIQLSCKGEMLALRRCLTSSPFARSKGVLPAWSFARAFAWSLIISRTASALPHLAAICKGVLPNWSLTWRLALALLSIIISFPAHLFPVCSSGVRPRSSLASKLALNFISCWSKSGRPYPAAKCRGVWSFLPRASTSSFLNLQSKSDILSTSQTRSLSTLALPTFLSTSLAVVISMP